MRIREIAQARPRFGYLRIAVLVRREGWTVNHKRVYRLYCLEGLQVRMRVRRRKHVAVQRGIAPTLTGERQRWSMDFVHDELLGGRKFRVLTVVDQWSRQSPVLEARFSFTGKDVVAALEWVREQRGLPDSITVDHGTEFMSRAVEAWAFYRGVKLDVTRPGKPTDNAHIESFNGRVRDECLNMHQFVSLAHAQRELDVWRGDYNTTRPHSSLGHLTPSEYAATGQDPRSQAGIS
jgi:putative transposase